MSSTGGSGGAGKKQYSSILPAPAAASSSASGSAALPSHTGVSELPPKRQKRLGLGRFACDACRQRKSAVRFPLPKLFSLPCALSLMDPLVQMSVGWTWRHPSTFQYHVHYLAYRLGVACPVGGRRRQVKETHMALCCTWSNGLEARARSVVHTL